MTNEGLSSLRDASRGSAIMWYRSVSAVALLLAPVGAQAQDPTLEQRVQALEDQLAIQRVITDYSAFLDARDYDGYVGLFTEDGVWQNGSTRREGRAQIREMLTGLFGEPEPDFVNRSRDRK